MRRYIATDQDRYLRRIARVLLALAAAAGTVDLFDAQTGGRQGRIVEGARGRVDVYDANSNRFGWGRGNRDGSVEIVDDRGNRLSTMSPG